MIHHIIVGLENLHSFSSFITLCDYAFNALNVLSQTSIIWHIILWKNIGNTYIYYLFESIKLKSQYVETIRHFSFHFSRFSASKMFHMASNKLVNRYYFLH